MSELELGRAEQETQFSAERAKQFLGWVFKGTSPVDIAQIPESHLPVMFDILAENAEERLKDIRDWRRRKQLRAPIELLQRWVSGQPYNRIYEETGKTEGTIIIGLSVYGEKVGAVENFDELMSATEARLSAPEEPQILVDVPAEPEETELEEQSTNGDTHYTRTELVRLLLQEVIEMPGLQEHPFVAAPEPQSHKQLFEDYPMMAKLSATEGLDQMLKEAGII